MNIASIIPARYASSRFPGKPLARIDGIPMIERVYKQAEKARHAGRVIVATDDERIAQTVKNFGGEVIMTREDHATGTDRLAEVAEKIKDVDIIVNVQGDEPLINPGAIDAAVEPFLQDKTVEMSTIAFPIKALEEVESPQLVKVVTDKNGFALYFSRQAIPFYRDDEPFSKRAYFGHMGLYVYSRACLLRLSTLTPTPLEQAEKLEQLRALENGIRIKVVQFASRSLAVDIPEDIAKIESHLKLLHA